MRSLYTRLRKCQPFDVIDIFQSSLRGHPNCEISMVYFSELVNHVSWHGYLTVPVRCGPIRKLQITWNLSSKTYAADFMIAPLWNYWWQKYYFFVFSVMLMTFSTENRSSTSVTKIDVLNYDRLGQFSTERFRPRWQEFLRTFEMGWLTSDPKIYLFESYTKL